MRVYVRLLYGLSLLLPIPVAAQTPDRPPALPNPPGSPNSRAPAGTGAAAAEPRRAHLPRHDEIGARAAVHQPGPEPRLRLQPRRGGRAFAEAARLDPTCAMAYWGQALVLGPNINAAMDARRRAEGAASWRRRPCRLKAQGDARGSAPTSTRSRSATPGKPDDRQAADHAFADAMREVARHFPDDLDAQTILRRIAHGPAPVELLDARRPALRGDARDRRRSSAVLAAQPESPGRAALLDPPVGADRHARARRGGSRSPAAADARRRPHRPHAGAHLHARRPARRRRHRRTSRR